MPSRKPKLREGDRPSLDRLHNLLDELIALRIEYGKGAKGEAAIEPLGPAKAAEVCTVLDTAITGLKRIIGEFKRPTPR